MNKKRLRDLLRIMLHNTTPLASLDEDRYEHTRAFVGEDAKLLLHIEGSEPVEMALNPEAHPGPGFAIVDDGCISFDDYIKEISKDAIIKDKVGHDALVKSVAALMRLFRDVIDAPDEGVDDAISDELRKLKQSLEVWTSIVPVENLRLEGMSELIVGNVRFRAFADEEVIAAINEIGAVTGSEEAKHNARFMTGKVRESFQQGQLCAEVTVEAESSRLEQIAKSEIDAALNLLRSYTNVLFPRELRMYIGLTGEIVESSRPLLSMSRDQPRMQFSEQSIGPLRPFTVTPELLEEMREEWAFDVLSATIAKPESKRSSLEEGVVTAIRWLGRGVIAIDLPEKVLNFAAASERLLLGGENKGEIGDRFARRMAYVIESDPAEQRETFRRAKHLYGVRSRVIHAGRTDVERKDVDEMEVLTLLALCGIADHLDEWTNYEQLNDWEQSQMFGAI